MGLESTWRQHGFSFASANTAVTTPKKQMQRSSPGKRALVVNHKPLPIFTTTMAVDRLQIDKQGFWPLENRNWTHRLIGAPGLPRP